MNGNGAMAEIHRVEANLYLRRGPDERLEIPEGTFCYEAGLRGASIFGGPVSLATFGDAAFRAVSDRTAS